MIAYTGDAIYNEDWSEEKRNGGLPPGRRASSHAFVAVERLTPVWVCTAVTNAASPSAAEV